MKKIKASNIERQILIGLIMSDVFIKRLLPFFDSKYLDIPAARIVSTWILDYYYQFKKAPKAVIQDLYTEKKQKVKKEQQEWISDFLDSISREFEKAGFNEDYLFERTARYFKSQRLKKNIYKIEDLLEKDKVEEAEQLWIESRSLPTTFDLGFNPFDLKTAKELMFREQQRVKLYTGIKELDRMTGPIKSGWLALFMGPQKRGKTWALMCLCIAACLQGINTVFISLESEDEELATRFWMMVGAVANRFSEADNRKTIGLDFPYYSEKGNIKRKKYRKKIINFRVIKQILKRFNMISSGKLFVKRFPMGTAGEKEINNYLDALQTFEDFEPGLIAVDYLGIMKQIGNRSEAYNTNAMFLKGMADERKAAVVSGHQGRRENLESFNIETGDVPEDVRILGHLDILFGMNQTVEEKEDYLMRLSLLMHRHRKFNKLKQVQILQQLEAGQFALDSKIVDSKKIEEEILARGEENYD